MDDYFRARKIARWLSYLIALILVLLPFYEFFVIWIGSRTGHLDLLRIWKEILIVLMAPPAAWLVWRSVELRRWLLKSWIARLYGLYILLHLILGIWAITHHQVTASALIYGLIVNLRFIGFFLLCAVVAAYDNFLKKYWSGLVLGPAAIVIVFGLLQKLVLPYDFLKHFGYGRAATIPAYETIDNNIKFIRVGSSLRGANPLGAYLVVIITAALAQLRTNGLLKPIYTVAALAALFFSYSRSAWIGTALALAVLVYMGTRRLRSQLMYLALALVVIFAGGLYELRNHQSVQDALLHTSNASTSSISSNAQRTSALRGGVQDIVHQPLGRGPGTAGPASTRNTEHPARIAEDYYLQIGQEVGVIGLAIFLVINYLTAVELWHRRTDNLARILLASLVGISFINLLSHAWADDTLSLIWWGLAGVALAPRQPAILIKKNKHNGIVKKTAQTLHPAG